MNKVEFEKIANGVWRGQINDAENTGLLRLLSTKPKYEGINGYSDRDFPLDDILYETVNRKNVVCIPFDRKERLYGLGLGYREIVQNYKVKHLRCDHYGSGGDCGRTHVPTPFYVSENGYGIFIDTSEFISFYMGGAVRTDAKHPPEVKNRGRDDDWSATTPAEYVEASFEGNGAAIYVFAGENALEAVSKFNLFCGGGALIPKWGLGFWHRVHIKYGENDVENEVKQFLDHGIKPDVIGLEPGWHSNSYPCTYDWDTERFPDPGRFVKNLLDKDIRVNLWENLFVAEKSSMYEEMKPYAGSHTVWSGLAPDFTIPAAREVYKKYHDKNHVSYGISGYKIDECDGFDGWLFPDHASFPSGSSAATVRETLGILAQNAIVELFRSKNRRTYGLVRASNAGSAAMPFCIYNDCYSFDEYMTGLASASFCGTLWVPEVRDARTPEEWVRRFQMSVFSPMLMINAWANGVKPWLFPEVEEIIKDTIQFRKSLIPYLYNAFYRYYKKGIPPFRALCLDFSATGSSGRTELDHTANPYESLQLSEVIDQYMAGDCVMVCVVHPDEKKKTVKLPPCKWYDYYTGEYVGCGETVEVDCPLDKMVLFVKEGGIVTTEENGKLIARCYGEQGEAVFYDDDGETFDCEKGDYSLKKLSFTRKNGILSGKAETLYEQNFKSDTDVIFQ